jgi:hypothetical protein
MDPITHFWRNIFIFGVFGHPWEHTICVFGESLLIKVDKQKPVLFNTLLRTNGIKG